MIVKIEATNIGRRVAYISEFGVLMRKDAGPTIPEALMFEDSPDGIQLSEGQRKNFEYCIPPDMLEGILENVEVYAALSTGKFVTTECKGVTKADLDRHQSVQDELFRKSSFPRAGES